MVRRIYVQKRPGFDVEAKGVLSDLQENLQIKGLENVIILNRYDVSGVDDKTYETLIPSIEKACLSIPEILKNGIDVAMNKFN